MRFSVLAALLFALVLPCAARADDAATSAALREDLRTLADAIRTKHPAPFHALDSAAFEREVTDLGARIPSLSRDQALLELARIAASIRDGHTALRLLDTHGSTTSTSLGHGETPFAMYPVRFYRFTDGWFVRFSDDRYAAIRGGRVESIAGLAPDALAERLAPYISRDNEMTLRDRVAYYMASPNVLSALGLASAQGAAPLVVRAGGKTVAASLDTAQPAGALRSMRDPGAQVPLWERHPEKAFWYDYDPPAKLLYVGYNAVTDTPQQTARGFFEEVFAFARAHPVDRCVVDLRNNGGGNGFLNKPLITGLIRSPQLDRDGVLFAVLGRSTFSAAQMAVSDLERWTNVTLAGEPGGQKPNSYGEERMTVLPRTGVVAFISSLYWQTSYAYDDRDAAMPTIDAELSSADERAGVDPALRAIARYVPLRAALAPALQAGDAAGVARVVRQYVDDPVYRYAKFEAKVNGLGYEELGAKRMPNAIALFRANADAHPGSANAYDSLGEALAAAGRVPEAVVAYRRALELTPESGKGRVRAIIAKLGG